MQQFLGSHGGELGHRVIRTSGSSTDARLSQYSDVLMGAFKATLTGHPLTYGVDSLLLSMADRAAVLEVAKTPFQQDVLETIRNNNLVAYPDADKLREKMNLPPSALESLDEELGGDEDLENHVDDAPSKLSLLDRSLQRKGFVKAFVTVGEVIKKGWEDTGKAIVKTAEAATKHIVETYTAIAKTVEKIGIAIEASYKAFVDFVESLVVCMGMGTSVSVGYGKTFPGGPKSFVAFSISIS